MRGIRENNTFSDGVANGTRTRALLIHSQALYQLSYGHHSAADIFPKRLTLNFIAQPPFFVKLFLRFVWKKRYFFVSIQFYGCVFRVKQYNKTIGGGSEVRHWGNERARRPEESLTRHPL